METERDCPSARSHRGRSEPMVQKGQDRGNRKFAPSSSVWSNTQDECPTDGAIVQRAFQRTRGLWLSWAGVDHRACCADDPGRVRNSLSPSALQSSPSSDQVQSTKAHPESDTTR